MLLTEFSILTFIVYFLIYAFLGWVVEVIFHATVVGKIVNRGFLNGPICPIYGFGVTGILLLLHLLFNEYARVEDVNVFVLYVIGVILCSLLELFGGWILDRLFHIRWWDYSDEPFNIGGYICLRFSLAWGFGVVFVLKFIHPMVRMLVTWYLTFFVGKVVLAIIYLAFFADLIITVMTLVGLDKKMKEVEMAREDMRKVSDELTVRIADGAIKSQERVEDAKLKVDVAKTKVADVRQKLAESEEQMRIEMAQGLESAREESALRVEKRQQEWQAKKEESEKRMEELYNKYFKRTFSVTNRLLDAFPNMKSLEHPEIFAQIKEARQKRKEAQK